MNNYDDIFDTAVPDEQSLTRTLGQSASRPSAKLSTIWLTLLPPMCARTVLSSKPTWTRRPVLTAILSPMCY